MSRTACPTDWRWPSHAGLGRRAYRRFQDRSDRDSTGRTLTCTIRELGSGEWLALFADSTTSIARVYRVELEVKDAFEEIFTTASRKTARDRLASSCRSHAILVDSRRAVWPKVAFVGRGMLQTSDAAQRLGYLRLPADASSATATSNRTGRLSLCLATGSQGEPVRRALAHRLDDHRYVKVTPEDTVVFSARAIPGNEKAIGHVMNHLARRRRRRDLRGHQARSRVRPGSAKS